MRTDIGLSKDSGNRLEWRGAHCPCVWCTKSGEMSATVWSWSSHITEAGAREIDGGGTLPLIGRLYAMVARHQSLAMLHGQHILAPSSSWPCNRRQQLHHILPSSAAPDAARRSQAPCARPWSSNFR